MPNLEYSDRASFVLGNALKYCHDYRHEFVLPEHLLLAMLDDSAFRLAYQAHDNIEILKENIVNFLDLQEKVPSGIDYTPEVSFQMNEIMMEALEICHHSNSSCIELTHLVKAMLDLEESWATYYLDNSLQGDESSFLSSLIHFNEDIDTWPDINMEEGREEEWRTWVTCMNDLCTNRNPLVGRKAELKRTIQVLCRCDKNNPLHVGEPGVGKTALVWGLARLIESRKVPKRLIGSKIYQVDLGSLLAGTQYRGDFEKRIKMIMEGITKESTNNIVYIDEIHTLVGAGASGENAMDASNMLKPFLESGNIRFIGSTTYEEYNKYFSRSKGLVRRFQQIDILEPTVEETENILRQLCPRYEEFHNVRYDDKAIDYAVDASVKHIHNRFLPDKAIDLIDEAGALMEVNGHSSVVGKTEIADILAKVCKVASLAEDDNEHLQLENLSKRIQSQIYGQDEAIRQVVEAVQMAKAGLLEENKPLASLLFVGPTGVGKTEVARVLSRELGIDLVRFDMSEYVEKHAVAKLIGTPAGYVGYDDGGLLTDAIRKSPNCVLLLDEIEKAHQDIYNLLLQVMDYARLTDNKGRQSDFRNVILIMTSNAGAQFASQASIGFTGAVSRGEAMMKQVKKTFKPEFLNRLSGTVIFHDMDKAMATLILKKKIKELKQKLKAKKVTMTLTAKATEHLLKEGYTAEYGAREMDRVISQQLKPLLMREILFGSLKDGGKITITLKDGSLSIR